MLTRFLTQENTYFVFERWHKPFAAKANQIIFDEIIEEELTTEPNEIYYLALFKTISGFSLDNLNKKSIEYFLSENSIQKLSAISTIHKIDIISEIKNNPRFKNKLTSKKSEYYFLGKIESQFYYLNKYDREFNKISTLNGIIFPFGIVTQVLLSNLHKPILSNYLNPNRFLLASNENYYRGYLKGAKSKMLKRGWRNFAIGVSINFAIVITWFVGTGAGII